MATTLKPKVQDAYNHLRTLGYPHVSAYGLLGRMLQESGPNLNHKAVNRNDDPPAHGAMQWRGPRFKDLKDFTEARGEKWNDSLITQIDFIHHELKNGDGLQRRAGRKLMAATTVEEGAEAAMDYTRPEGYTQNSPRKGHGWDNTVKNAHKIADFYEGPRKKGQEGPVSPRARPDRGPQVPSTYGTGPVTPLGVRMPQIDIPTGPATVFGVDTKREEQMEWLNDAGRYLLDQVAANVDPELNPSIQINSAYRTPEYNKSVDGARFSRHMEGDALDISLAGKTEAQKQDILRAAVEAGVGGIVFYPGDPHVHLDMRGTAMTQVKGGGPVPGWARTIVANRESIPTPRKNLFPTERPEPPPGNQMTASLVDPERVSASTFDPDFLPPLTSTNFDRLAGQYELPGEAVWPQLSQGAPAFAPSERPEPLPASPIAPVTRGEPLADLSPLEPAPVTPVTRGADLGDITPLNAAPVMPVESGGDIGLPARPPQELIDSLRPTEPTAFYSDFNESGYPLSMMDMVPNEPRQSPAVAGSGYRPDLVEPSAPVTRAPGRGSGRRPDLVEPSRPVQPQVAPPPDLSRVDVSRNPFDTNRAETPVQPGLPDLSGYGRPVETQGAGTFSNTPERASQRPGARTPALVPSTTTPRVTPAGKVSINERVKKEAVPTPEIVTPPPAAAAPATVAPEETPPVPQSRSSALAAKDEEKRGNRRKKIGRVLGGIAGTVVGGPVVGAMTGLAGGRLAKHGVKGFIPGRGQSQQPRQAGRSGPIAAPVSQLTNPRGIINTGRDPRTGVGFNDIQNRNTGQVARVWEGPNQTRNEIAASGSGIGGAIRDLFS